MFLLPRQERKTQHGTYLLPLKPLAGFIQEDLSRLGEKKKAPITSKSFGNRLMSRLLFLLCIPASQQLIKLALQEEVSNHFIGAGD